MNHTPRTFIKVLILALCLLPSACSQNWSQFRGERGIGFVDNANIPVKWDVEKNEKVKWKTEIPGLGHSCPVIWQDKIFVTTAISASGNDGLKIGLYGDIDEDADESVHQFRVYCLDKKTGKIIWNYLAHEGVPITKRHTKSSHANPTPATDGKHLLVFFGSEGLYCLDLDGKLLWKKDLGRLNAGPYNMPEIEWGMAASPVIYKDKVVIQADVVEQSFLACFDIHSGDELWRSNRDEIASWGSPNVYDDGDPVQVIVNGWKHMGGYNIENGEEIWKMSGGGDAPSTTPIVAHDHFFINNAHGRYSPIYVVKPTAKGDITLGAEETSNEFIPWSIKRGGAYMQTPLIYGDYLYNLRGNGALTVFHALTGEVMYKETIGMQAFTASGVASDGKIYFSSEQGTVYVIKAGKEYELLSTNPMGDICMATPAMDRDAIYFRTQHFLIAIGE
ncbi:MAG: PQQ-binding-like beta-propeller repeat protein [Bacteroidetes bacterium]|jgi:outer membrane protein assembly factor BamB|nr:PQQ-binding-like beta-propeller repeat protein [Bacteroidota bacterium]MBT3750042.1 PQQ-binding-like beta-propeller repeat protein [Bacteroidota bacterium]MBT4398295.1 PQQ-binding-like beta-propeller repeat protein [Bacteroidota bacterium]MBT4410228.1 PQQ-binding-like beta-propeller repeat protein [Bacteroidota bacterium]MBT7095116.1 PQQ-binding-like beta-propeller repeat protein [Bacteroidota bacterium]